MLPPLLYITPSASGFRERKKDQNRNRRKGLYFLCEKIFSENSKWEVSSKSVTTTDLGNIGTEHLAEGNSTRGSVVAIMV